MNREKIIFRIIKNTGLSRNEIQEFVEEKISRQNKTITENKALILIAKDLFVDINYTKKFSDKRQTQLSSFI